MSTPQSTRQYPSERYYYGWYGDQQPAQASPQSDGQIKSEVVDRLRQNVHTKDHTLVVNVQSGVVVLTGDVSTVLAKRAAGGPRGVFRTRRAQRSSGALLPSQPPLARQ